MTDTPKQAVVSMVTQDTQLIPSMFDALKSILEKEVGSINILTENLERIEGLLMAPDILAQIPYKDVIKFHETLATRRNYSLRLVMKAMLDSDKLGLLSQYMNKIDKYEEPQEITAEDHERRLKLRGLLTGTINKKFFSEVEEDMDNESDRLEDDDEDFTDFEIDD